MKSSRTIEAIQEEILGESKKRKALKVDARMVQHSHLYAPLRTLYANGYSRALSPCTPILTMQRCRDEVIFATTEKILGNAARNIDNLKESEHL